MKATALIPAYNEEARIGAVVAVAREAGLAVLVVDDGSTDRTAEAARQAGAEVLRLEENQGKSAALAWGLSHIETPYLVLLDADLVGLRPEHLRHLLEPVEAGRLEMTIGLFRAGGLLTDLGNRATPHLSGQRACRTDWLRSVPNLTQQRWPEPAITEHLARTGARWAYVQLEGASQVMKEQKRGFWKGLWLRLKMYGELLRYRSGNRA
ncbi:MAG: glycosyltransferase family 2 protein [Meiothermus sp.]|uniref:glycosyltransferase family 2 protein n=1 Tax=Meiothermus sp. TaxID=1955249 RepID=UPI0025EA4A26|nr:glycosyltransferase family 2 protein [Meiothermus sp.]MCS7057505.1 glycosyltransferase family 2 protein [Meiothermus sp.]MCS7194927.1 glycosyltransferase family 2 protein [Meiothermus sp.]MCX7739951.1 glycosyltransferase family 2 protein [Meiothermus sp.]MDW8090858.1 glycosyltransferase family 2 protein [Meiothermus sp.]MDW8482446.1 glycosyltransferase family 2 protein [Meiothermus sp.]